VAQLVDALVVFVLVVLIVSFQFVRYRVWSNAGYDRRALSRSLWLVALAVGVVTAVLWSILALSLLLHL
jgi:hypothetical protein